MRFRSATQVPPPKRPTRGFTIVELLVVIAIIAVLLAMIVPSMESAYERARRASCAARLHAMILASTEYAGDHKGWFPTGIRNGAFGSQANTEHVVYVPSQTMAAAAEYGGFGLHGGGESSKLLTCPNFQPEFGYYHAETDNYVIGYSWLAGVPGVSAYNQTTNRWATSFNEGKLNRWETPRRTSDPLAAMIADHNTWSEGAGQWMFVAHTAGGALGERHPTDFRANYFNWGKGGPTAHPEFAGSEGGNVGLSDGSAAWKPIQEMYVYEGCAPPWGFPAMW